MKTWIFRILINRAISRAQREERTVPFSSLADDGADEPAVDPDRFRPEGDRYPGGWRRLPDPLPEQRLLERETLAMIDAAIGELPDRQQLVIMMRDIEGWSAEEVCQGMDVYSGLGLTTADVLERRGRFGAINLAEEAKEPGWRSFLSQ